jgi:hypothetical protein
MNPVGLLPRTVKITFGCLWTRHWIWAALLMIDFLMNPLLHHSLFSVKFHPFWHSWKIIFIGGVTLVFLNNFEVSLVSSQDTATTKNVNECWFFALTL